jgi:hypothetical protein
MRVEVAKNPQEKSEALVGAPTEENPDRKIEN